MTDHPALQLCALGSGFNLPPVQALRAPLPATQPTDGVLRHADQCDGDHARHVLDVDMPKDAGTILRPGARLPGRHGFSPALPGVPDLNHVLQTVAINTGDRHLSGPIGDVGRRHA